MSAIHVVVRPHVRQTASRASTAPSGLFDVVVDGVNVTARIGEGQTLALLAELAHVVGELISGRRSRATLRLYTSGEAWELGLEADGPDALLTVYRAAPSTEVAVDERRLPLLTLRDGVLQAIGEVTSDQSPRSLAAPMAWASELLRGARLPVHLPRRAYRTVRFSTQARESLILRAQGQYRCASAEPRHDPRLERGDLHGLLVKGRLQATSRERTVSIQNAHLFLVAERLLSLAEQALEAWLQARPLFRRVLVGTLRLGVRRGPGDAALAFTIGDRVSRPGSTTLTFPEMAPNVFVDTTCEFATKLVDTFVQTDPAQARNLRLAALADAANRIKERAASLTEDDSMTNLEPDTYRSFPGPTLTREATGRWSHGGMMRVVPRWVATVPHIDLRATVICEDRVFVGTHRELVCLAGTNGEVLWKTSTGRAGSLLTGCGLVRVFPDGRVVMHDLDSGLIRFTARLIPRQAGGATGAVIHAAGLPKLLIMAESDRCVTALDLMSGETRWRYTARTSGSYRMRRAGRLLVVAGGDPAMVALDVTTGDIVWRTRERLPFSGDLVVDAGSVFALSGGRRGLARLHRIDAWTGRTAWTAELNLQPVPNQPPLVTEGVIVLPVRDHRGLGAIGVCRTTGKTLWEQTPGLSSNAAAWLAVPDGVVVNTAEGSICCLDALSGIPRFSHVFAQHIEAEQPRRLEPVLRSGALFVPQHQVVVLRPGDGELIGAVPGDLVPDWMRVDNSCGIYVAEESGHLAAFGATPKLTRVK